MAFVSGSARPPSAVPRASIVSPDPVVPEGHMSGVLSSLFANGKYSDLLVKCKGQQWRVHKAVMCMLSKPIGAAFDRGFMEASTGEIDLEDDNPQIFNLMLEYMYKGSLNIPVPVEMTSGPTQTTEGNEATSQYIYQQPQSSALPQPFSAASEFNQTANTVAHQQSMQMARMNNRFSVYSNPGSIAFGYQNYGYTPYGPQSIPTTVGLMYPPTFNLVSRLNASSSALGPQQPANSILGSLPNPTLVPDTSSTDLVSTYLGPRPPSFQVVQPPTSDFSRGLITAAEVYIVADKYDVEGLNVLACNKYSTLCSSYWNNEHFIESLSIIFDNTPDTNETDKLRVVALDTAVQHAKELLRQESFQELCQCRGDIATAVLMASVDSFFFEQMR